MKPGTSLRIFYLNRTRPQLLRISKTCTHEAKHAQIPFSFSFRTHVRTPAERRATSPPTKRSQRYSRKGKGSAPCGYAAARLLARRHPQMDPTKASGSL